MTSAIDLAIKYGIAYYATPEGTTEMHGSDRQVQAFAEAVAAAAIELERKRCYDIVLLAPYTQGKCDVDEWGTPEAAIDVALKAMAFDITAKIRGYEPPSKAGDQSEIAL